MRKCCALLTVFACLLATTAIAAAHGGVIVANRVEAPPVIDGQGDDAAWDSGFRYPLAFNQLNEQDQVWTDLENLSGSFRLVYSDNTLYGIVYRQDNMTNTSNTPKWENDCIDIFFDFAHDLSVKTQNRALVGLGFGKIGGVLPQTVWSQDGTICEFAIDLSAVGLTLESGMVIGFNIALGDADEGMRHTQLYPFPGNNTSSSNLASLGDLLFR